MAFPTKPFLGILLLSALFILGCTASASTNTTVNTNPLGVTITPTPSPSASASVSAGSGASVKSGDHVFVNYVGTLSDGTVFDTSIESAAKAGGVFNPARNYTPLDFTVGGGQMIKGFDAGVVGMKVGETKTLTLAAKDAYGERDETLVQIVPLTDLSTAGLNVTLGMHLTSSTYGRGVVTKLNATDATIDFNSPLAGKTLTFVVTLVAIK